MAVWENHELVLETLHEQCANVDELAAIRGGSWGNIPKERLPWIQNLMSPLYGSPMRLGKKSGNSSNNSSMPPFGMPLGDMMNQWPFNQKNFDPFWVFRQGDGQGKGNCVMKGNPFSGYGNLRRP